MKKIFGVGGFSFLFYVVGENKYFFAGVEDMGKKI